MTNNLDKKWDENSLSQLLRAHASRPPAPAAGLEDRLISAIAVTRPAARRSWLAGWSAAGFAPRWTGAVCAAAALFAALFYGTWRMGRMGDELISTQVEQANEVLDLSVDYSQTEKDSYLVQSVDHFFGRY